jgi:hypothetical protein
MKLGDAAYVASLPVQAGSLKVANFSYCLPRHIKRLLELSVNHINLSLLLVWLDLK